MQNDETRPVSPYLRRPLRSIDEVLAARRTAQVLPMTDRSTTSDRGEEPTEIHYEGERQIA